MRITIDDPADPRIADYVDVRERDLDRGALFMAEGDVVLAAALTHHRPLRSVLVSARRVDSAAALLARVPPAVPIYVASQVVMDAVVGFPIHRGLLALGERGPVPTPDVLLAERLPAPATPATVLVAIGISNHDNLGGLFRNAAAFACAAVLLDPSCCDPLYRKAIRVSVGGALCVPLARAESVEDLLAALTHHGFDLVALAPRAAHRLDQLQLGPRRAILVGAEGPGLPPAVLARTQSARIDIATDFDSLNVVVAAGIALHALAGR
jgi:tRNA G18 (ribose-2'-O)-methylase SpoU